MLSFSRYLAAVTVVAVLILNVAGGKAILLSLASIFDQHRTCLNVATDGAPLTQIWLDSRDPDPSVVVRNNGTLVQWEGESYRVLSVVQCGVETLYICSRDESRSENWMRFAQVSPAESNPLKSALNGNIVFEYYTHEMDEATLCCPSSSRRFLTLQFHPLSVNREICAPPPRVS